MPDPGLLDDWPQGAPAVCQPGLQRGSGGLPPGSRREWQMPPCLTRETGLPYSKGGPPLFERRTPLTQKADPPHSTACLSISLYACSLLRTATRFYLAFFLSLSRSLSRQWTLLSLLFPSLFRSGREVFAFGILSSSKKSNGPADLARQPGSRLQRTQKGPEPTRLWALA